ncbi:nucleotidyltransferase family protein [Sinomonas notoginsengisoli]|uniref:nucleotidyltransferase family protein n=1 Tax=Sinomonas notoginsengisoli TaxID=1457311 RepID=UPI001F37279D|nr:nucleotidyltransferase family protein [Sinomonas notoginsengisoli]
MPVAGILLAAGAGSRYGLPKALAATPGTGSWLERGIRLMLDAACSPVVVVLGAESDRALALLSATRLSADTRVVPLVVTDWSEGIGGSLRGGFEALGKLRAEPRPVAALVTLVDLPRLAPEALARLANDPIVPSSLRRAVYGGIPGHPVLIGSDHWAALGSQLAGDVGASPYLRTHGTEAVDCTGLGGEDDIDVPERHHSILQDSHSH